MSSNLPVLRGGGAIIKNERQAVRAFRRAQLDSAVIAAYGTARAQAITHVSREAIRGFGDVAVEAEDVVRRCPWAEGEALMLTHRAARALSDVIDDVGRWS